MVVAACLTVPPAAAAPAGSGAHLRTAPSTGAVPATALPKALDPNAKVSVIVQLKGDPVAVAEAKSGGDLSATDAQKIQSKLESEQTPVTRDLKARGGQVVSQMQSAYNGVHVLIARKQVDQLAQLPNVESVHVVTPKAVSNTESVPFLGVPQVWQSTGYTGKNVKVAIIDTGIDYTHADFGGPGTTAAYAKAHATSAEAPNPALVGPKAPRVKGGYDFAGDAYDASGTAAQQVPHPDSNPLDCDGHGSHVAGSLGGSGVTESGKTYTGPYNSATEKKSFEVGPGVAPQADLYSLKIFGCTGTTELTTEAIDWAVKNHMNVINMSLGGAFGRPDDPDAVAASNAVAAGTVVVASAGNEGSNPYLAGAPSTGHGVLSVSAVDSLATFPGAVLTSSRGKVSAIDANGAPLPTKPLGVVVLKDDPATAEDESLGCSPGAFTAAGIQPGRNQIAVVERGNCARAAKAIYGQEAGAAAVLMVNTDSGYPPYEGAVTSNPDTGAAFNLTIPFLGVPSTQAAAIAALDGQQVSFGSTKLANPGYRGYADFSSAGPASGDSSLAPTISAPGVSISSVAVGTGSGATVMSGTSMASPHVAGVAALAVQAHRGWTATQIAATLGSTASPQSVAGYEPVLGGGLVDAAHAVSTTTFAEGDHYKVPGGTVQTASLSFGFAESTSTFVGRRTITVVNKGSRPVTYTVSSQASGASRPATLSFSTRRVTVRAHSSATVQVTLKAPASKVGSSLDGEFGFYQISGNVVLDSGKDTLRVPYLMVPRAQASVAASSQSKWYIGGGVGTTAMSRGIKPGKPAVISLTNRRGALAADASVFTWGLSDPRNDAILGGGSGFDLRAAGVQTIDQNGQKILLFAINNWDRWSNAAANEFDVSIDTNGDGVADYVVFSTDSGFMRTGDENGETEVFIANATTHAIMASGFMALAPTDSSTIELPVLASDLGLSASSGSFSYTVDGYGGTGGQDSFGSQWAHYNPWTPAIQDGANVTVPINRGVTLPLSTSAERMAEQKPKGVMIVTLDNHSGSAEASLLPVS